MTDAPCGQLHESSSNMLICWASSSLLCDSESHTTHSLGLSLQSLKAVTSSVQTARLRLRLQVWQQNQHASNSLQAIHIVMMQTLAW